MFKLAQIILLSANILDTTSSLHNINYGRELNPIVGKNSYQIVGVKLASESGELYLFNKFNKNHHKLAVTSSLILSSFIVAEGVHNMRVGR
jgi:hypothetical protein